MGTGYENLIVYQLAVLIFDLNAKFCSKYLNQYKDKRTIEQMIQAGRSGKQNIVEGSLERSSKMYIRLTAVSRGSFGELMEDYRDFLRIRNLKIWDKGDLRVLEIRKIRISNQTNEANGSGWVLWSKTPEDFANLMICLLSKENYLLDKMIKSLEEKFIKEGGYSENLTRKRLEAKRSDYYKTY